MTRSKNILAAALALLMVLIAAFFGSSIYNAKRNDSLRYLDEMDQIFYFDAALIPKLNFQVAIITLFFIVSLLIIHVVIILKSEIRVVKNIAIGLLVALFIILIVDILTLINPEHYDFSKWGYIWLTFGLIIIAGNLLSIFIKPR